MSSPLFSIVMPVFNRENFVGRAIESVINQSFPDWELIICDDASSDSTKSKISFFLHDPRITFLSNESNLGPAASRNKALKLVRGSYICFLDSDDFFFRDALQEVYSFFCENRNTDVLVTTFEDTVNGVYDEKFGKTVRRHISPRFNKAGPISRKQLEQMTNGNLEWEALFLLCQCFFKRECLSGLNFPEDKLVGEDRVLFQELISRGSRFSFSDVLTYHYEIHGSNLHCKSPAQTRDSINLGMIIPIRDRFKILEILLNKMDVPDWVKLYVVEDSERPSIPDDLRSRIDGYRHRISDEPFNRSAASNLGVSTWNHPYYLFHDVDLVPGRGFWGKILDKLTNDPIDFFFPWDRIVYLDEENSLEFISGRRAVGTKTDKPIGGSLVFDRNFYMMIGGMNEDFKGWGLEDFELIDRANWFREDKKLIRLSVELYHLWHGYNPMAPPESRLQHEDYRRNSQIFSSIQSYTAEQREELIERLRKQFSRPRGKKIFLVHCGDLDTDLSSRILNVGGTTIRVDPNDPLWLDLEQKSEMSSERNDDQNQSVESEEEILEDWVLEMEGEVEEVPMTRKSQIEIGIMIDEPGWAFDNIATHLSSLLAKKYTVHPLYLTSGPGAVSSAAKNFDVLIVLGYQSLRKICKNRANLLEKTVFCGYDHLHYESPRRDPNIVFLEKEAEWVARVPVLAVSSKILLKIYERIFPDRKILLVQDGVDCGLFQPFDPVDRKLIAGWCGNSFNRDLKGLSIIRESCHETGVVFNCLDVSRSERRSHDEMPDFYRSIDVYLCASLSEGTPNPILEASACGLPWISTPVGIVPELWSESYGGLIVGRSVEEFKLALMWMKQNRNLLRDFGNRNRMVVLESFTWEKRLDPIFVGIEAVASGRRL